jgi:cytoskeletal protein RodZ
MNMKLIKRVLAATLAATLMVAPVLTAGATEPAAAAQLREYRNTPSSSGTSATSTVSVKVSFVGNTAPTTNSVPAFKEAKDTMKAAAGGQEVNPVYYEKTTKSSPAAAASFQGAADSMKVTLLGDKMFTGQAVKGSTDATAMTDFPVPKEGLGKKLVMIIVLPGGATKVIENAADAPAGMFRCNFPLSQCSYMFAVV